MSDVYRPLFVMVEAIEAEAKRLLEPPKPKPETVRMGVMLCDYERELRKRYDDRSLHIERSAIDDAITVGHRCKACGRSHWTSIPGQAFALARDIGGRVDLLLDTIDALLSAPCDIGLEFKP
jgi:hypothetical protein